MYNSLLANCSEDFNLWVLCMDDTTYNLLEKMDLPKVKLISLKEFESPELLEVKKGRNVAEYSWTCASNFIWFLLQKHKGLETLIYLDADLYFFNDPKVLIDELGDKDVMITEHRYTKEYDQTDFSGKYCVQFMIFKNNNNGLVVLDWWRRACLDWCFNYLDNGRLGDQKYLDDWTTRFNGVHELQYLGGGVAPWNVQQYDFFIKEGKILGRTKENGRKWLLVFYHFHSFRLTPPCDYFSTPGYNLSSNVIEIIYDTYFKALQDNIEFVKKHFSEFNYGYKSVTIKEKIVSWAASFGFIRLISKIVRKKINK